MILTADEISALTGGLRQPAAQLRRLRELGYYRAWRSKTTGEVILERGHYEAVSGGATMPGKRRAPEPQVMP